MHEIRLDLSCIPNFLSSTISEMKRETDKQTKHEQLLDLVRNVRIKHPKMGVWIILGKIEPDFLQNT